MFEMLSGFRGWCHLCNKGFKTIDALTKHNTEMLNQHRNIASEKLQALKDSAPADNKQSMAAILTCSIRKDK